MMSTATDTARPDEWQHASLTQPSSSSPLPPMTSPTTYVVQNRQHGKPIQPNSMDLLLQQPYSRHENVTSTQQTVPVTQPMSKTYRDNALPTIQGVQLVPATALPDQLRSVFRFELFNAVQSKCFVSAFKTDDNLVVSAPTGSGKTVIMELAICRLMAESRGNDFKVVYQAPTKSLCAERYRDWQTKFGPLNMQCAELTGDTDISHLRNVQSANIIITTPEKWDSVTRKWKDHVKLIQLVKLFLVDEVHILKECRGAVLEAVVSRMKSVAANVRFIALSATVPNSQDIATWLGRNSASPHMPALREVFGESFRPVELKKYVYGFEARGNDFAFESMLTQQLPDIISKHGHGKPVMIFCSTRKATTTTAKMLADMWSNSHSSERLWKGPVRPLSLTCNDLKVTSVAGVAFHHGGLDQADRRNVEQAFLHGQINVICSTSTLAVGVNLPCYLVILKGTNAWTDNGLQEYADLEVMQMLGRAGRPQFETSASAVILTRKEKVSRYQKMVSGEELLESCLHRNLIEHLNAEIGLGTVYDLASAKQWLAGTFLHVRMKQNPSHYRFREDVETCADDDLLEQLCQMDIALLSQAGLVEEGTRSLSCTGFGEAMARYYVSFETMKSFIGLPPKAKLSEILTALELSILAEAKEFRDLRMMAGEKSFYKEINKAPEIKFPIKVDVALQAHKVSLLIQAELGNVTIPDGDNHKKHHQAYRLDKCTVFIHASRLIRCIIDCQIHLKDAVSTRNALELGRSLAAHVWDNTASHLRQIDGLGEVSVRKLASASIDSIDTLMNTEPSRIELVLGRNPPFGRELLKKLESFPNLRLCIKETGRELKRGKGVTIRFLVEIGFLNVIVPYQYKKKQVYVCFLAETSDGSLIDFRRFSARNLQKGTEVFLSVELIKPTSYINCHVMCVEVAGTSKYAELRLKDIPASIYPRQQHSAGTNEGRSSDDSRDQISRAHGDEFDDGGIDDQDLLAMEVNDSGIETVEDIDEILDDEDHKNRVRPRRRFSKTAHATKHEHDDDDDVSAYKEPTQLSNGRWTCQHVCNERKKDCKHKCCKEGVTRPKRRPKAEPKIKHEDKTQTKITSLTNLKRKAGAGETEAKQLDKIHNSVSKSGTDIKRVSQKSTEGPVVKKVKLSKGNQPGTCSGTELEAIPQDLELGSDVELCPASRSAAEVRKESEFSTASYELGEDFFNFASDGADVLAANKAWANLEMNACEEELDATLPELKDAFADNVAADFLMSEFDLGGTEPTLEHVAFSDVLRSGKGLFIMGDSSSPVKKMPQDAAKIDLEEQFDPSVDCGDFSMKPLEDISPTDQLAPLDDSLTTSSVVTPPELTIRTPELESNVPQNETEEERKERLYEEDQKKKWEGIDQWLYDELHEYVEIV
ncbi:ATP-dependent DNA helicase MER3 [Exophiala xenobiotica]|nr:ATP-dependent DNA helicase MER3 [Exophiala xenobiotica]KAK5458955.1 ATP-dependent DNA helicase MER3 [Exophiala xenobiotica]